MREPIRLGSTKYITHRPSLISRNHKSLFVAAVDTLIAPLEIELPNGGEAFWLDARTIANAVDEGEGKDKVKALYAINVKYEADGSDPAVLSTLTPALIGKFPTATAGNFKYNSGKETLVFSDNVYALEVVLLPFINFSLTHDILALC